MDLGPSLLGLQQDSVDLGSAAHDPRGILGILYIVIGLFVYAVGSCGSWILYFGLGKWL